MSSSGCRPPAARRASPASGTERSEEKSADGEHKRRENGRGRAGGSQRCGKKESGRSAHFSLEIDLLVEVNQFLHPLHGLHAGVAFFDDLGDARQRGY